MLGVKTLQIQTGTEQQHVMLMLIFDLEMWSLCPPLLVAQVRRMSRKS